MAQKRRVQAKGKRDVVLIAAIVLGIASALSWTFPARTYSTYSSYDGCVAYYNSASLCASYRDNEWESADWSFVTGRLDDGRDPALFVPFTQRSPWCSPNCTVPDKIEIKWFPAERAPLSVALLAGSFFLLLLRRR
jgi:hypothetical protein